MWRVEQSEITRRFYVVRGYNKARKVWTNKIGACDFIKQEDAICKAAELNKS